MDHNASLAAASAGKIHLLNLATLKDRLGARWDRASDQVHAFFESAIKRSLGAGDTFVRTDELSYVLMFGDLSSAQAQVKCAAISSEVCRRLFGESGMNASLRNLVTHVDVGEVPSGAGTAAAVDTLLEMRGKEVIVSSDNGTTIARETTERDRTYWMGYLDDPNGWRRTGRNELSYVYRPLWDVAKQVVLTYLCQPVMPPRKGRTPQANYGFCGAGNEEDQLALDLTVLDTCATRVRQLDEEGHRLLIGVPIHFQSLARSHFWQTYSAAWRGIDRTFSRYLAFMVFGLETGVPNIRLAHEFPKLATMTKYVFCAVDNGERVGARYAKTGAHAIGLAIGSREAEQAAFRRIDNFVREAGGEGMESFVLGARSTSLTLSAMAAGVRFVEGNAILPAQADPRYGFARGLEDLYQAKLATKQ